MGRAMMRDVDITRNSGQFIKFQDTNTCLRTILPSSSSGRSGPPIHDRRASNPYVMVDLEAFSFPISLEYLSNHSTFYSSSASSLAIA